MTAAASILSVTAGGGGGSNLAVSIGPGTIRAGYVSDFTFPTNTAVPRGGTGPYTYEWTFTHTGVGTWSTSAVSTITPQVTGAAPAGTTSIANYICKVIDNVGNTAVSNTAVYEYINLSGGFLFGGIL